MPETSLVIKNEQNECNERNESQVVMYLDIPQRRLTRMNLNLAIAKRMSNDVYVIIREHTLA